VVQVEIILSTSEQLLVITVVSGGLAHGSLHNSFRRPRIVSQEIENETIGTSGSPQFVLEIASVGLQCQLLVIPVVALSISHRV
jgi:hypothetical protein